MSSTNRGSVRSIDDLYITPPWAVARLLEAWPLPSGLLLEPACGDGAIIDVVDHLVPHGHEWMACDVREVSVPFPYNRADFLLWDANGLGHKVQAVITNPPFCLAEQFLRHSRKLCPLAMLVFLLRLNFFGGNDRAELGLWRDLGVPDTYVLPNRPDFSGDGGDSCEYAWLVFPPEPRPVGNVRVLATTPLEVRKAQRKTGSIRVPIPQTLDLFARTDR